MIPCFEKLNRYLILPSSIKVTASLTSPQPLSSIFIQFLITSPFGRYVLKVFFQLTATVILSVIAHGVPWHGIVLRVVDRCLKSPQTVHAIFCFNYHTFYVLPSFSVVDSLFLSSRCPVSLMVTSILLLLAVFYTTRNRFVLFVDQYLPLSVL